MTITPDSNCLPLQDHVAAVATASGKAAIDESRRSAEEPLPCRAGDEQTAAATVAVLHVINGEYYSGAERVQDLLAQRLGGFGYRVDFACLKPGLFRRRRTCDTAEILEMPMRRRWDVSAARRIAQLANGRGYRLLHAHTPRSLMIAAFAARRCRVPLVYHVHSPAARDSTQRLQNLLASTIERLCLRRVSRVIAVSASLAEPTRRIVSAPGKVVVVPNGVPGPAKLPEKETPRDEWTVGTVALFRPRKGTEVLVRALADWRRRGLPVRLLAVGPAVSDAYHRALRRLAESLGVAEAVEWTGFCTDVSAELARMDVFVLPSLFGEGLPMVVLEAMAHGVPVVASRVEGIPEAIRDRRDGLLVEPGSVASLSGAVAELIRGRYDPQELRQSAFHRQHESFSDVRMARGVAAVYDDLLG